MTKSQTQTAWAQKHRGSLKLMGPVGGSTDPRKCNNDKSPQRCLEALGLQAGNQP